MTFKPNTKQQEQALRHLRYEIAQFVSVLRLDLERSAKTDPRDPTENAILESVLLHARALDCFFGSQPSADDDVLGAHFDFRSRKILGSKRKEIHKWLAHLTYTRIECEPKEWDLAEIGRLLVPACAEFARNVVDNGLAPGQEDQEWRQLLAMLDAAIAPTPPTGAQPGSFVAKVFPSTSTNAVTVGLAPGWLPK